MWRQYYQTFDVIATNDYVYIVLDVGLRIIDANPFLPALVGYFNSYDIVGVAVAGNYAYVADGDRGLRILSVANPATPTEAGRYNTISAAQSVAVLGRYAYVANGIEGLSVVNISNPGAPFEASRIAVWLANSHRVAVSGDYVYVDSVNPAASARRLSVISAANLAAPTEIGSYSNLEDIYDGPTFAVVGNYIYAAAGFSGLRILDVSNPTDPVEVSFYDPSEYARGVAVTGRYAYVLFGSAGVHIVDVSDPTNPHGVGVYSPAGYAYAAAATNDYAYIVGGNRLSIIDVSNPAAPTEVGFYNLPGARTSQVVAAGNYVYIANGAAGLRVIDVSDPTTPTEISFYATPSQALGVAVVGNYAYVADEDAGLLILRLWRDVVAVSVPPTGGALTSTNGDTSLIFPAGTFTGTVNITYRRVWADYGTYLAQRTGPLAAIGHTFELTAVYSDTGQPAQPAQPYTLTVHYSGTGPAIEGTLELYYWDGARWVKEPSSAADDAARRISGAPDHFSLWAVLGDTRQLFLPVITRF